MWAYELAANESTGIKLVERPLPEPGPGQVRVRVRAASLNYRDLIWLHRQAGRDGTGTIPLSDGAGEISAVGPGVSDWQLGDRVISCFFQGWQSGRFRMEHHQTDLGGSLDGMLAQEVILAATGIVPMPEHLDFAAAACLPCAALTAWYALKTRGQLQAGDVVLTLGTGGVSIFALQIARAAGCRVLITSSSDEKLARAKRLGAEKTINYRNEPDWHKLVWEYTQKQGVDHVIEVGGPSTLASSIQCVAPGGQIALIGVLTGFGPPDTSLFPLVVRNAQLNGIYVGSRADFLAMNEFLSQHQIKPMIDRTFSYQKAIQAYEYLESGQHFGKVVILHH